MNTAFLNIKTKKEGEQIWVEREKCQRALKMEK